MFKIISIKTLLYRAYHLSSSYSKLSEELNFLKTFFKNIGYPLHLLETQINKFLNSMFSSTKPVATVKNEIKYFSLPYYSPEFENLADTLKRFIEKSYHGYKSSFHCQTLSLSPPFFRRKDKPCTELLSNIAYKFTCKDLMSFT